MLGCLVAITGRFPNKSYTAESHHFCRHASQLMRTNMYCGIRRLEIRLCYLIRVVSVHGAIHLESHLVSLLVRRNDVLVFTLVVLHKRGFTYVVLLLKTSSFTKTNYPCMHSTYFIVFKFVMLLYISFE